jgi:serine/threonine-protein kinase
MTLATGTKLGRYEIRSKIGEGGMGEVYLAQDTKLDRKVALKILPADVAARPDRMKRFVQEAKAASALNHPSIITIYEIDKTDSINFIATEFIDGETLRQRMKSAPMRLAEVLEIAAQIASALSAAHAAGIVHRDIKPENVMLRRDGIVKVLDFGLAKLTERLPPESIDTEALTSFKTDPGTVVGTAIYMSPEQAGGLVVDARTDNFSLGVVMFEMVAGRLPFEGSNTHQILASILSDKEPQSVARYSTEAPAELERIVSKALRKEREQRYQTMKDLTLDLQSLKRHLEFEAQLERSRPSEQRSNEASAAQTVNESAPRATAVSTARVTSSAEYLVNEIKRHKASFGVAFTTLIVALGVTGYFYFLHGSKTVIDSIAVLPFVNAGADPNAEYLSDGITESLINSLSQLPQVKVMSRNSVFRYKGRDTDAQKVGEELGVRAVLAGRVTQHGDGLEINVELVAVRDNTHLWGQKYNRKLADILSVQDEIASEISDRLRLQLSGEEKKRLTRRYTDDAEAYQEYLKGLYYADKFTESGLNKGIEYFKQAIEKDPNYALAYAGIAHAYWNDNELHTGPREAMPKAKAAALKALEIDETLPEAHAAMGIVLTAYDWDWPRAEAEFKRAIELNQDYATAHNHYGWYLSLVGRFDDAIRELKQAQQLDPFSLEANSNLGLAYCRAHRYNEAIDQLSRTIDMEPTFWMPHTFLGWTFMANGRYAEAIAELNKAKQFDNNNMILGSLGEAYALSGNKVAAQKMLDELGDLSKHHFVSPHSIALVYAGLGERDLAFQWLEKAYGDRTEFLGWIKVDQRLDGLRSDPRFANLMQRVRLSQ